MPPKKETKGITQESKVIEKKLRSNGIEILQLTHKYDLIAEFPSIASAERVTGISRSNIDRSLDKDIRPEDKYIWLEKTPRWKQVIKNRIEKLSKLDTIVLTPVKQEIKSNESKEPIIGVAIIQLTKLWDVVSEFISISAAVKSTGISRNVIMRIMNRKDIRESDTHIWLKKTPKWKQIVDKQKTKSVLKVNKDMTKPTKSVKRKKLPAVTRMQTWFTHIGSHIGKLKCPNCNVLEITQMVFECGHIVASAVGGDDVVENLRPICGLCNKSMSTTTLNLTQYNINLANQMITTSTTISSIPTVASIEQDLLNLDLIPSFPEDNPVNLLDIFDDKSEEKDEKDDESTDDSDENIEDDSEFIVIDENDDESKDELKTTDNELSVIQNYTFILRPACCPDSGKPYGDKFEFLYERPILTIKRIDPHSGSGWGHHHMVDVLIGDTLKDVTIGMSQTDIKQIEVNL